MLSLRNCHSCSKDGRARCTFTFQQFKFPGQYSCLNHYCRCVCTNLWAHINISFFHLSCAMEVCSREVRQTTGNASILKHCPSIHQAHPRGLLKWLCHRYRFTTYRNKVPDLLVRLVCMQLTKAQFIFSLLLKQINQDASFHAFSRKNVNFIGLNKEGMGLSITGLVGDWYLNLSTRRYINISAKNSMHVLLYSSTFLCTGGYSRRSLCQT